ncbi:hypothetical protein JHN63_03155 [Streptomyces sp. MBT65]|nr:hypothetical protein [Streptomyces sp. MBT65]MBK3572836.1 hypothetical protein [Streptomyces sp. MBT65]
MRYPVVSDLLGGHICAASTSWPASRAALDGIDVLALGAGDGLAQVV